MIWQRNGLIFDAHKNLVEPGISCGFAQSPQLLEIENAFRIYFSTRRKDQTGKYLSYVFYVDFDKQLTEMISISKHPVISLGSLGSFDEHGIFPLHVRRFDSQVYGFIGGWSRRSSVSVDGSIGLAISNDNGQTFERAFTGPILAASSSEPFLIGDPFVLKHGTDYFMFYIYGLSWISSLESNSLERVYKIGLATSHDLINWNKSQKQIIPNKLGSNECQALPTVCYYGGKYHMIFCYRNAVGFRERVEDSYRFGYAYSTDFSEWIRDDEQLNLQRSADGWDSDMMCYPHLVVIDDKLVLFYNGNNFGKYGFGMATLLEL
jgi:predicted GH43/DUF377 family glycosyl hydrolase